MTPTISTLASDQMPCDQSPMIEITDYALLSLSFSLSPLMPNIIVSLLQEPTRNAWCMIPTAKALSQSCTQRMTALESTT